MRRRVGTACIVMGAVCVLAALSLFLWNRMEDRRAGAAAEEVLPRLIEEIERAAETADGGGEDGGDPSGAESPYAGNPDEGSPDEGIPYVEVDGHSYMGYLTIPALGLELPVLWEWRFEDLKISPCRYSGSIGTDDLVIAGHNYSRHFGTLKNLAGGDEVFLTGADGVTYIYEVTELEVLSPSKVEEMTDSGYDLTLFTCTYGGRERVAVRCTRTRKGGG